MEVPQKLKIELPNDPAISLLGTYSKKTKTLIRKDGCTQMLIAALFTIAKVWNWLKHPSTDKWLKNIHTMKCSSSIKKNDILPFAVLWIDLENIMLSEI